MKILTLTALGALLLINAKAQELPTNEKTGKVSFSDVVQMDSTGKDVLFTSAKAWLATAFNSSNDVIQMADKESGKIIGKGAMKIDDDGIMAGMKSIHPTQAGYVNYTITLKFKDGRYKYEFTDFVHKAQNSGGAFENIKPACGGMSMAKGAWAAIKNQAKEKIELLIANMKESIQSNGSDSEDEDW